MHWPDIFFKSKKPKPAQEPNAEPNPESAKPTSEIAPPPQPPTIKPVPASATVVGPTATPLATPVSIAAPAPIAMPTPIMADPKPAPTLPVTHGVVLRPPTGRTVQANASLPQIAPPRAINPPKPPEPMKNIEQLMEEADPVRTLRQTGNVRVLAPLTASAPETAPLEPLPIAKATPTEVKTIPTPSKVEPVTRPSAPAAPAFIPPAANLMPVPTPTFRPAVTAPFTNSRRIEPRPAIAPTPQPVPKPIAKIIPTPQPPPAETPVEPVPAPEENDSPFILKSAPPVPTHDGATKILPPAGVQAASVGSIFRRKARMADVARIVLPPKREDTQLLRPATSATTEPSPTVVPPAFPVAAMTARATQGLPKVVPATENLVPDRNPATPPPFAPTGDDSFILKPERVINKAQAVDVVPAGIIGTSNTELPALDKAFDFTPPGYQKPAPVIAPVVASPAAATEARPIEPLLHTDDAPKLDPEAHKPAPTAPPEPRIDPEAHKPFLRQEEVKRVEAKSVEAVPVAPVVAAPPASAAALSSAPALPEKREFHLANGERVAGKVLSETPDAVYIEHSTLGVVTIPRVNIAKRLVEIILVNGDRIVGDILAETADTLYVKHASLGMLTVPRAARSTRVVEAILKDGDRILGEVLTETDTFTVIRSASLGTITIPHAKLAMLNRKVEQIEMKALPPVAELKDKAS